MRVERKGGHLLIACSAPLPGWPEAEDCPGVLVLHCMIERQDYVSIALNGRMTSVLVVCRKRV